MTDEQFFGPEWDLANIAANARWVDGYLLDLLDLAENGMGSAIGVLTNGMVVVGTIATAEELADELDRRRRQIVERIDREAEKGAGQLPDDWADAAESFATSNRQSYEDAVQEKDDLETRIDESGEGPWDYSSQPKGLARESLEMSVRTHMTLLRPQIHAPGQPGLLKPRVLRVAMRQIAAWWPVQLDDEGRAQFSLFSVD